MVAKREANVAKAAGAQVRSRLKRGKLSRSKIIEAALRIMDEPERPTLTFALLGRELDASPSAMYRHFANRDDIIDAVGDELIRLSLDGYAPHEDWRKSLWDLAERAWVTYAKHPGAAAQTYFRVTRGFNELRAVDAILEALHCAGLAEGDAVRHYHSYSTLVLALSADHATKLAQIPGENDESGWEWEQVYEPRDPGEYPYYWAVRDKIRQWDPHSIFRQQIDMVIESVCRTARRTTT